MKQADNQAKGPVFLPRADGLGWALNFERKESWFVLTLILVVFIGGVLWGSGLVQL